MHNIARAQCPVCKAHMDVRVPTADIPFTINGAIAQSKSEVNHWEIGCDEHTPQWCRDLEKTYARSGRLIVLRDELFAAMVRNADSSLGLQIGELLRDSIDLERMSTYLHADYPAIKEQFHVTT